MTDAVQLPCEVLGEESGQVDDSNIVAEIFKEIIEAVLEQPVQVVIPSHVLASHRS
jgi:hypothetical protein